MSSGVLAETTELKYRESLRSVGASLPLKKFPLQFAVSLLLLVLTVLPTFAQRPLGTDVSGHQPSVNWTTVKNAGVTFAWTKATESTNFVSSSFTAQEAGAKAAGIFIGAYHFARPSMSPNITGVASADTEAAFFWSVASNYVKNGGTYLVPMLDWEDENATNGFPGFTTAHMSAWVNEWCNSVSNFAQLQGVTVRPIVYTGTWYSNPINGFPGLNTSVTNWPDWIAEYPAAPDAQNGAPESTFPWPSWNIWQYADTNWSGGDADVFNGTANALSTLVIGGLGAPFFVSQPVNDLAIDTGGSASFSAPANGLSPLHYQWLFNGTNITDATNTAFTLTHAQATNAGNYTVIVTNASGSVTSSIVSLAVYPPQATVFSDNFDANTAANWVVNNSSADNAAAFNFDYSTLGIPSAPNSTNGSTRGVQLKANLTLGTVAALSISPANQSFSGDYRVHFDAWMNVNGPFPGGGGGSTEFLTAGLGTSGNRVEWTGNASADGFYFSVDGEGGVSGTSTSSGDYVAYMGATQLPAGSGVYDAGTDTGARDNANLYYTTAFPNGQSAPPLQQTDFVKQTGALNSGTFGFAWHDVIVSRRSNTVDWVVDGIRLATISNATFTSSNVFVGFWDPFATVTDNTNLNFGLVDNLRVEVPAIAPVITTNPLPQLVRLGTNVTFIAAATGLPAPLFQWQFNGTNISAATNSSFTLVNVALTNAGLYSAIASNLVGSVTSSNALLSLVPPAPAEFQTINVQSGGTVQINFTADPGWTYIIETSSNLVDWNTLTNLTSADGSFQFTAGSTTNSPQLFYRARVVSP